MIDGEAVLILADASQINVLNQVGSLIYELSDGQHSVADIASQLAARFDVSYAQAESDTLEFLHGLETQSIMILETR
ncbi:MAG: PqqD family protein [Ardenticatenaceae bacterium]|nr:PqqD family protein [Anaerolineales bacterium]MCB8917919.1 PqqD family protein [Ardenticatenaceae bacterium]